MFQLLPIQNKVLEPTTHGKKKNHKTIIASVTESDVFKYEFVMSGSVTVIGRNYIANLFRFQPLQVSTYTDELNTSTFV